MNDTAISQDEQHAAHARKLAARDPGFALFFTKAVQATDDRDLAGIRPEDFEAILRRSYARLGEREAGQHSVSVRRPEKPLPHPTQIIDVFVDDMPFVVDSTLAAIRAQGGTIRLMTHPILPVDASASPWKIQAEPKPDSHLESFLQVHIDPIGDEERTKALRTEIDSVLDEVRLTVRGWRPMLERLRRLVQDYRQHPPKVPSAALAETLHFLAWLADHNFTFLGMREYRYAEEQEETGRLEMVPDSGLGILEDPNFHFLRHGQDYVEMTEQHVAFLKTAEPLMVTKANVRSRVHRRAHMDYIGVKLYDDDGNLSGELRILGLFTSMSLATPHTEVPLVRRKISEVMRRSGLDPKSHAGKALMAALDAYPREELFQITEDQLFEFASIISSLADRPRVRVLPRIDRFDNFVSVLLYLPRDRYSSEVRERIGVFLAKSYDGRVSAYYPHFPEGDLVRVHFIIGRNGGRTPRPDRIALEKEVAALTRTFGDRLLEAADDSSAVADYWDAFSPGYQSHNSHEQALADIAVFKSLSDASQLAVRFSKSQEREDCFALKVYHRGSPIPLSSRVPLLENFGFRVIDERSHTVRPRDGAERYLHDMVLMTADDTPLDMERVAGLLQDALLAVWRGEAESDGFNQLALKASLAWDDIAILRAFGRYLKQVGLAYSQRYLWSALAAHPNVAGALVQLFHARLNPTYKGNREADAARLHDELAKALEGVSSIDEDASSAISAIWLKWHCAPISISATPRGNAVPPSPSNMTVRGSRACRTPAPSARSIVYSPRVEGIHMRGGAIARGGLRWSDRPEDFRTEVLGLMKAQMVKNAVIVPVGAKGGFVPKLMPQNPDRETFMAEGTTCYKIFVGALLDITDNLQGKKVLPPKDVVRADGDDPYLVVAADKGTASFSDTANAIAISRDYWLGDAFASGGSAGYDHKKMGITARGAWEAVKRHFREMNRDIQTEPFTVTGVGDMSGDVFGNGMLLSEKIRLIAAFDHRDIFIDPDPDTETSFAERRRLFERGRSSWQDYDQSLLSKGGGIYSRGLKTIPVSPEAATALGIEPGEIAPQELMVAILAAEVDLLWFGGIGTYIAAKGETPQEIGDRANDAIRITGDQVRAKVIGEGANLAVTQRGRIEYALNGGCINTDAIDNSAGVNSSDLEVNIKIALGTRVRAGEMTTEERNEFLVEMTPEVAELCLRNNYLQTLALSLAERRGLADMPDQIGLIQRLEQQGHLNRAVEFLPDDLTLSERASAGKPLTRPELAVLLAYAKNTLYAELLESDVPDDPYLAKELFRYFPDMLEQRYPETIEHHRLRREVISTVLANALINRGGPSFVYQMTAGTSASAPRVAFAYAAARDSFGLIEINAEIDALDARMDGPTQLDLYAEVQGLQIHQTLWFLRNLASNEGLSTIIGRYGQGIDIVRSNLDTLMPEYISETVAAQTERFVQGGAPEELARRVAELSALVLATDIVLVGERTGADIDTAATAYFKVLDLFHLGRITEQGSRIALSDRYDRMALDRALANLMRAQRELTTDVIAAANGPVEGRLKAWRESRAAEVDRIVGTVRDLTEGELTVSRLSVAAGLLSDLVRT